MTASSMPPSAHHPEDLSPAASEEYLPEGPDTLILRLRQKQGDWVGWGQACQQLQKAGYSPQSIFEQTGFEPIHQNQVMVAAQVYAALGQGSAEADILEHFRQRGSDSLYELRILNQQERVTAATWLVRKEGNSEAARDLAKAMHQFKQLRHHPPGFSEHPGDALAWECWRMARQQSDLTLRSRLIARGLRFVFSSPAREQLETLLVDLTAVPEAKLPRLPWYRLEADQDCPRVLPVAGQLPLTPTVWQQIPVISAQGPFGLVPFVGEGVWVALPGWMVLREAEDPIGVLASPSHLPESTPDDTEVLVIIDRGSREWSRDRYHLVVDDQGLLRLQWFAQEPTLTLWGTLVLVVRPPRILDPEINRDLWHLED
ncbi:MAG: hypothetical protein OHK0012_16740 [Synechococcales cyanobacterium]